MSIFVTVGSSNLAMDFLIEKVDELVLDDKIKDDVTAQIGHSVYIPKALSWFRFDYPLSKYYSSMTQNDIVLTHGGAGTLFELLETNIKIVTIENPSVKQRHHRDLLCELEKRNYLIWCRDIKKLLDCIESARSQVRKPYKKPKCQISKSVIEFIFGTSP